MSIRDGPTMDISDTVKMSLLFLRLLTDFSNLCQNVYATISPSGHHSKKLNYFIFSSKYAYSPTNIVKVGTLNRKGRNICLFHSLFSLDADSSKLIAVPSFECVLCS